MRSQWWHLQVSRHLTTHPRITSIHLTGSKATYDAIMATPGACGTANVIMDAPVHGLNGVHGTRIRHMHLHRLDWPRAVLALDACDLWLAKATVERPWSAMAAVLGKRQHCSLARPGGVDGNLPKCGARHQTVHFFAHTHLFTHTCATCTDSPTRRTRETSDS